MNEVWQDRVPPQDIEAEQAVLGAVFLDSDAIIEAMELIEPRDF
jgi:replicative DNA helicase